MRDGKLFTASFLVSLAVVCASCLAADKPSPLPDLHNATRVIALPFDQSSHEFRLPADSLRIAMLADALEQFSSGWTTSTDAPPHPNFGVTFIRDSAIVAVVWIGSEFIAGFGGKERLARRISLREETQLRALLNPGTAVGVISNQPAPHAPQN
jgi:hypothetical protein